MSFIKSAMAESAAATAPVAQGATAGAFSQTIMFTVVLALLFYFLLIRPQQKRYKEHSTMLGKLGVGDKIVTQGGMIGTIDKLPSEKEVVIDFGNNIKMTVLRSSIMGKYEGSENKDSKK